MTELWGIIVLCFASIVTATPYGYGVKGGATAKAEANAAAGAFAGLPAIPLSIPSGPGISGSFSKSSSSSFASSSASSSSSSSSFSFSGAGANDVRVNGGCSGGCPNKGANDGTLTSNGAFDSNYKSDTGNAAAATTGTGQDTSNLSNYSKTNYQPCEGDNCNEYGRNLKCSSGQCLTDQLSENHADKDDEKDSNDKPCTSADCKNGLTKQIDSEGESNDIKINVNQNSKHKYDANSNSEGRSKDDKSTNGCYNGNCYPAVPHNFQPSNGYGNNNVGIPTPISGGAVTPKCLTPNCNPYNPDNPLLQGATAPGYNKPSQHLSTPNYGPVCTTYPCYSPPSGADNDNEKLPTSYHVPISPVPGQSSIPQNSNRPCLSGPCLNNDLSNNLPNSPSVRPSYGARSDSSSPVTCTTGTCNVEHDTSINTGRDANPSYGTASYSHGISPGQYTTQPSGPSLCQGPNCNKLSHSIIGNQPSSNIPSSCGIGSSPGCGADRVPDAISGPERQPGRHTDFPKLSHTLAPNIQPEYHGLKTPPQNANTQPGLPGFITGSGIHNTDESFKHYAFNPNAPSIHTPNTGLVPPTINYPTNSGSYSNPHLPSNNGRPGISSKPFDLSKPNTGTPHSAENVPTYTSDYGAPASSYANFPKAINGNGVSYPNGPGSYGPYTGTPNFASHSPSSTVEFSKPNNFGPSSQYHTTHAAVSPGGVSTFLSASPKPAINNLPQQFEKKDKLPYTGGFGGPAGLLKPNDYNLPANVPTSPVDHNSGSCSTGDCSSKSYKTVEGSQSTLSNAATSSASSASANAKATAYTGGFGGPAGFLKPNDNEKPANFIPLSGKGTQDYGGTPQYDHSAGSPGNGNHEHSRNEEDGSSSQNNANAVAQASAVASAQAGAFGNSNQGNNKGCSLCNAPNTNGSNGNYATSSGLTNAGIDGDFSNTNNAGAVATAKSVANAGASSYGSEGSFASSSASAHASAGVPRKGGYGLR